MSIVYVKFPRTGLGNLLLVWARACVFAHLNNLPLTTSPWWAFRPGAWIRNEKKKRLYFGYFKESSLGARLTARLYKLSKQVVYEPAIKNLEVAERADRLFFFHKVITDNDLFGSIRPYREFVRKKLYEVINPRLLRELDRCAPPVISVHIRRGDFKMGNPITSQSFFIDSIQQVRLAAGENWPVTVFTDAEPAELTEVLAIPGVQLSVVRSDILDILLMSKSRVIVLSQSSTFSYWGAFLSDAVVLKPAGDWQGELRGAEVNSRFPEISWKENNEECVAKLVQVFKISHGKNK